MNHTESFIKGKHILAVDDEPDVLETIEEILNEAQLDTAQTHGEALKKILDTQYDLAILDIMGVNGMGLLEECVKRDIPAVILTANAMNPDALMESIKKGALSYLSKEHLSDLDVLLNDLMTAKNEGKPAWKLLFEKLGSHFDRRFGQGWKTPNKHFWNDFEKEWAVSRGIQERLRHDRHIVDKGI